MIKSIESPSLSRAEKEALVVHQARKSLIAFSIATDEKYQDTWFHRCLADILEKAVRRVEAGEDVRIIIEAPPRHGKSEVSTKKFPSWVLGEHPDWPIIAASYSGDLAEEFGLGTRDIMQSQQYQKIFGTRLRKDSKAKSKWKTDEGGSYTAVGAEGAITGKGFKIGIIDDIFKDRKEADSQTIRDDRWNWLRSTFMTRQEGASAIIIINTRWHTDDIVGRLEEQERKNREEGLENYDHWEKISFPAIAIEDEFYRDKGEALWPAKYPIEKLKKLEIALGPYEFSALYQCRPITSENQEFKNTWFKYRTLAEVLALNTRKFATIDPGGKKLENDYTGIVRNYVDQENNWSLRAMGVHFDSMELCNFIFVLHDEGFEVIAIEETVYLRAVKPFFDEMCKKRNKFPNVVPIPQPATQKEVRIRGLIPRYSSGSIYHILGECADLESQLIVFPKGANDDVPDALAMQNGIAEPPQPYYQQRAVVAQRQHRKEQASRRAGMK